MWVAAWRGMAPSLPAGAQLADDPYGLAFAERSAKVMARTAARWPALLARGPLFQMVTWLQIRTRALDDAVAAFVRGGGAQIVLLGAGFDARASRLPLDGARVFEIDHPATQARKRRILGELGARPAAGYLAWNFERDPMDALPSRLAELGLDLARPTLTIWEGVTMYLTEPAIDATVAAVKRFGGAGSQLVFTYFDRDEMATHMWRPVVALLGEPYRFGWNPTALPSWLEARGLRLDSDRDGDELARALLPQSVRRRLGSERGRHIALAGY
jgi:methyltransferase (TIGR00027 family)